MSKLNNITLVAKLYNICHLRSVTRNVTRRSSTFEMMIRYEKIKKFHPEIFPGDVDDLVMTPSELHRLIAFQEVEFHRIAQ